MENNTTFLENASATTAVTDNMRTYIRYSNTEFLPNTIDGLKLLWRRILLVLNHSDKMMKCTALTGACMQTYHPHGDSGVEDGIVSLGQPFKQTHAWLVIKGNFGAYAGAQAAAGRYLDVYQSPFAKDIFFNMDSRTLTYIQSETGDGVEPLFLIPALPTALLFGGKRLAAAFLSNTPFLNFSDVCTLVEKYIALRKKYPTSYMHKYSEIAKYCLPDFPSHAIIRNSAQVLSEYAKGNFNCPVVMDGVMEIEPDRIRFRSIPYGTTQFEDILNRRLGPKMNSANFVSATANEILDLSVGIDYGDIGVKLKRGVNPFEVLAKYKQECSFEQSWLPQWCFVDTDGCVVPDMNPMRLLTVWYEARYRSILAGLKFVNNDLFKQYRKLSALIVIADHTDEVLKIFKGSDNREATIPKLIKAFGLTREQAEYISSLQLHQITRQGKDDLLKALAEIKQKIADHQKKFISIDDIIVNEAKKLAKTYSQECPRRTYVPKYIGAIVIPEYNGYIQFESIGELVKLFHRWGKSFDVQIKFYNGKVLPLSAALNTVIPELDAPKEFKADGLAVLSNKPAGTVIMRSGCIFRVDELLASPNTKDRYEVVGDEFLAIKKGYKLVKCNITDIPKRAIASATGVRTDIVYFSNVIADRVIVAIADTNYTNSVLLKEMRIGDTHTQPLIGKSKILGIWKYGDPLYLELPEMFVARCATRQLIVLNSAIFMNGKTEIRVNFNRKRTSDDRALGYLHKNAEILSDTTLKGKQE